MQTFRSLSRLFITAGVVISFFNRSTYKQFKCNNQQQKIISDFATAELLTCQTAQIGFSPFPQLLGEFHCLVASHTRQRAGTGWKSIKRKRYKANTISCLWMKTRVVSSVGNAGWELPWIPASENIRDQKAGSKGRWKAVDELLCACLITLSSWDFCVLIWTVVIKRFPPLTPF